MKLNILPPVRERKRDSPNFACQPSGLDPEYVGFLREYGRVRFRLVNPEDEDRMIDFHKMLAGEDGYLGYFKSLGLNSLTVHDGLAQACVNSEDSHISEIAAEVRSYYIGKNKKDKTCHVVALADSIFVAAAMILAAIALAFLFVLFFPRWF
jgi:hypothetical protein